MMRIKILKDLPSEYLGVAGPNEVEKSKEYDQNF